MTFRVGRIVSILCLAAVLFSAALLPACGYCETLRFVFMADSRGNADNDLINTAVLNAINTKILALSPRPSFVVYGGDQAFRGRVNGIYNFEAFKTALKPLTDANIKLYTALGNHELYEDIGGRFIFANQVEYQKAFKDNNPKNGPSSSYDHLVYSFESPGGDAFFAVLDPYYITADVEHANITGTIEEAQRNWLKTQVAATKASHKFLFTHGPYYYVNTPASPVDTSYTELWKILDDHRFDIYFCGHSHLYSRKTIDSSIDPKPPLDLDPNLRWKNNVVQVLNGTCGAPIEKVKLIVNRTFWHVYDADNTYYFSVVDINGSIVTVTSYSGNTGDYNIVDSFTVPPSSTAVPNLLLTD